MAILTLTHFFLLIKANTHFNEQEKCMRLPLGEADDTAAALRGLSLILGGVAVFPIWCLQC